MPQLQYTYIIIILGEMELFSAKVVEIMEKFSVEVVVEGCHNSSTPIYILYWGNGTISSKSSGNNSVEV